MTVVFTCYPDAFFQSQLSVLALEVHDDPVQPGSSPHVRALDLVFAEVDSFRICVEARTELIGVESPPDSLRKVDGMRI